MNEMKREEGVEVPAADADVADAVEIVEEKDRKSKLRLFLMLIVPALILAGGLY
jgi:hypothetical protein